MDDPKEDLVKWEPVLIWTLSGSRVNLLFVTFHNFYLEDNRIKLELELSLIGNIGHSY